MQDALADLALPHRIELDLVVEPMLEPVRIGHAALDRVARKVRLAHVQVGRVQRLGRAARAGHQHADLGESGTRFVTELFHRTLHVAQIGAAVARFVLAQRGVDVLDDRLGMPFGGAAIPMVEANLAAEMQHERFERRRRIEIEAHVVQLLLGRRVLGAEALEVFHQHQ